MKPVPYYNDFIANKNKKIIETKNTENNTTKINENSSINDNTFYNLINEKLTNTVAVYDLQILSKDILLIEAIIDPSIYSSNDQEAIYKFNVDGAVWESHNIKDGSPNQLTTIDKILYSDIIKIYESVSIEDRQYESGTFKIKFKLKKY